MLRRTNMANGHVICRTDSESFAKKSCLKHFYSRIVASASVQIRNGPGGICKPLLKPQLCAPPHAGLVPQHSRPRDWVDLGKGALVLPPDSEHTSDHKPSTKMVNSRVDTWSSHHREAIREASFASSRLGSEYPVSGRTAGLVVWKDRQIGGNTARYGPP